MTTIQIVRFKAALEAKRQELANEIRARSGELVIREGEHDPIDQVQGMSQRDEAGMILHRLSRTLSDVDAALRAMSQGLYGDCVECGEPVSLKRLETIPWASHCIGCQESIEQQEAARGGGRASAWHSNEDREAA